MENNLVKIKIILLGDSKVGKSSIIISYLENNFIEEYYLTYSIPSYNKNVDMEINGKNRNIRLIINDSPGEEKFRAICKLIMRNTDGIILVYSVNDKKSFENISKEWVPFITNYIDINETPIILIGNKIDLYQEEEVNISEIENLIKTYNIKFFQCSCKNNIGINEAFTEIIKDAMNIYIKKHKDIEFKNEKDITPKKHKFQLTDREKEIQNKLIFDPVASCFFAYGTVASKILEEEKRKKELERKNRKCVIW